jgi:hypothetical protein
MRGNPEEVMPFPRLSPIANRVLLALAVFTFACWSLAAAALLTWGPGSTVALKSVGRIAARISPRRHVHARPRFRSPLALELASARVAGYTYSTGDGDPDFAWALIDGEGETTIDASDGRRPLRTRDDHGPARFWFRDGDDEYEVTDPAIVSDVQRAAAPVRELGREMGVVGGEMGKRGAVMGRLGGKMGALGARLAILESRLVRRSISRSERAEIEAATREMRGQLRRLQSELSTEQGSHARSQRELSRRMSVLSARHQAACRKARLEVREIARRAQRQGKAGRPHANA